MAQAPPPSSSLSNLVRLAPLQVSDLPDHPDLPRLETDTKTNRPDQRQSGAPDLEPFLTALLDDGGAFLEPSNFTNKFKRQSTKSSPPSAAPVEISGYSIPASTIKQIRWSASANNADKSGTGGVDSSSATNNGNNGIANPRISRTTPPASSLGAEHWIARRSVHKDISSKSTIQRGHASWDEFVYGLRDDHSKHEAEFTPSLYDAHCVLDWAGVLSRSDVRNALRAKGYTACSMAVYEMCHAIPPPLSPRCFPVLVVTASLLRPSKERASPTTNPREDNADANTEANGKEEESDSFIAITVPVDLRSSPIPIPTSMYSTGRNVREGKTSQQRKRVGMGVYAAVETVRRDASQLESSGTAGRDPRPPESSGAQAEAEIEWIMATASDAKGVLPMWIQKTSVPGAVAKDVGYFMKWIRGVDDAEIKRRRAMQ